MLKILRNNLKKSWLLVIFIIVFLIVQAAADLNLPDFTSNIVNVGIQQKGIENTVPEVVSKATFDKVLLISNEDELLKNSYTSVTKNNLAEKEYKKVFKKYKEVENINAYMLKKDVSLEDKEKLNTEFSKSLMVISVLENEQMAKQIKTEYLHIDENID